jgi:hypothetical protein
MGGDSFFETAEGEAEVSSVVTAAHAAGEEIIKNWAGTRTNVEIRIQSGVRFLRGRWDLDDMKLWS